MAIASQLGTFAPFQSAVVDLSQIVFAPVIKPIVWVSELSLAFMSIQQTKITELDMRSRVAELESNAMDAQDLAQENKWLREQLSLGIERQSIGTIANVVRYEYSPNVGYLYVDVGDSMVAVDDVAVVNRYVVGEVVEVHATLAKVRLITANQSEIPVKVGSNTAGVLHGRSGLQLVISDVDAGSNVQIGDEVRYLTPLGADVGKFILGKVIKITAVAASPTMELEMETPLDLFNLHRVILLPNQRN